MCEGRIKGRQETCARACVCVCVGVLQKIRSLPPVTLAVQVQCPLLTHAHTHTLYIHPIHTLHRRWRDSRKGVEEEEVEIEEEDEDGGMMMGGADLGAMLQGMSGPDAQVRRS